MQEQFNFNQGAIKPIQCLSDGWEMLKGFYGISLGIMTIAFLIILVSSCLPFAPLVPPIICGIYLCMFAAMQRQPFSTSTLFKGFEFFGPSFLAFLVLSIPLGLLGGVLQIGITILEKSEDAKKSANIASEEDLQSLFYSFGFIFGMLFLIYFASLVIGTLTAFVYPLIVDRKLKTGAALKLSFRAVMGNFFGVVGLMLLGQVILIAGVMLCYVGALFVAPVIFAAWTVAYRRVFPLHISPPPPPQAHSGTMPQQQNLWTPPVTASKAGLVLTLTSLLIVALAGIATVVLGNLAYQNALKIREENKIEREKTKGIGNETAPQPNTNRIPRGSKTPSADKAISYGVLNGKADSLPKPIIPRRLEKAIRGSGAVNVEVTVDEDGNVTSATAVSGHPSLRVPAEEAARSAKFKPTILSGKAVKISGVIVYNFVP